GFSSYVYLLATVRPALATSYAYVNPVVAVALGVWLGGEQVDAMELAGMAVILAGVVMVCWPSEKAPAV
ncbi:MAG: EamA family transporter, partial [Moraxellaceae bacterium]